MKDYMFILDGKTPVPIEDPIEWSKWMADSDRKVKVTELLGNVVLSTVFLGINHRFVSEGPPILFETMIFGGDHEFQERHLTWDDAVKRHNEILKDYFKIDTDDSTS